MFNHSGAAAHAVTGIINYIRSRRLTTGDSLPSEAALCEELGCSRSSVREAVRTLSSLDIVEVRHGHGTYVADMSLSPMVTSMVFRIILDTDHFLERLLDVVNTRQALDLWMTDDLVSHYRGEDMSQLQTIVEGMRARRAKGELFTREDRAFHAQLVSVTSNPLIKELSDAFWQVHMAVLPHVRIALSENLDLTVEAHQDIINALYAGDAEAYRRVVVEHYSPLKRAIDRHTMGHRSSARPN